MEAPKNSPPNICTFYKDGKCRFGSECHNLRQGPVLTKSSTTVAKNLKKTLSNEDNENVVDEEELTELQQNQPELSDDASSEKISSIIFHLFMRGSFYPFHKGHLNLFDSASQYILKLPWPSNIGISIENIYISPTHPNSLAKKYGMKNSADQHSDSRCDQINRFLEENHTKLVDLKKITIMASNMKMESSQKIVSDLRQDVEANSSHDGKIQHRLVQVIVGGG